MKLLIGSMTNRQISEKNGARTVTVANIDGGASYAVLVTEAQYEALEGAEMVRLVVTDAQLPSCICDALSEESLNNFSRAMDMAVEEVRDMIRGLPKAPVVDEADKMSSIAIGAGCTTMQEVQQYLIENGLSPMSDTQKLQAVSKRLAEYREVLAELGEVGAAVVEGRKANAAARLQGRRAPVAAK